MKFWKTFLAGLLAFAVGSLVMMFLSIMIIIGIASAIGSSESVSISDNSILKIDMSESITDSPSTDPFAQIDFSTMEVKKQLSLMQALRAIEAAKDDDRIKGIYLRMNGGGETSLAILEELRGALADFKESGKFIVSYNETYGQGGYYLASVADKIYIEPNGAISWQGMAVNMMFYKGLFDKLDINAEVFRPTVCKYKSAVEPYIMNKMSDANREQMQTLLNSMWSTVSQSVAESRGLNIDTLNMMTDRLAYSEPEDALKGGLVDSLTFEDGMNDVFKSYGVEPDKSGEFNFVNFGDYAMQVGADFKNMSAGQVAIVYADGEIVDGEGEVGKIYGNTLAATIRKVRKDDKVKSVVLRVNSPGGSALASDVIWSEIMLLKAVKPVVVSMGSYAASGGYYISCPADAIVADKMTLTGSIGVFGMFLDTSAALKNKLGITTDGVKTNTSADFGRVSRPITAAERIAVMKSVDKVYATFTGYVAKGRNLPIDKVLDIAGGRVWSGADALSIGLIDSYGGLKAAIAIAAEKAELGDTFRVVEIREEPTGIAAVMSAFSARVKSDVISSELGDMFSDFKQIREATSKQGILMYSPYKLDVE